MSTLPKIHYSLLSSLNINSESIICFIFSMISSLPYVRVIWYPKISLSSIKITPIVILIYSVIIIFMTCLHPIRRYIFNTRHILHCYHYSTPVLPKPPRLLLCSLSTVIKLISGCFCIILN